MSSYKTKYQPIVRVGREILDCHIYDNPREGFDLDEVLCRGLRERGGFGMKKPFEKKIYQTKDGLTCFAWMVLFFEDDAAVDGMWYLNKEDAELDVHAGREKGKDARLYPLYTDIDYPQKEESK